MKTNYWNLTEIKWNIRWNKNKFMLEWQTSWIWIHKLVKYKLIIANINVFKAQNIQTTKQKKI